MYAASRELGGEWSAPVKLTAGPSIAGRQLWVDVDGSARASWADLCGVHEVGLPTAPPKSNAAMYTCSPSKVLPARKVTFTSSLKMVDLSKSGRLGVRLPATERTSIFARLVVDAKQAKRLGIKLPKGQKEMTIGNGSFVAKKAGVRVINIKLTPSARKSMRSAKAASSARLTITLSQAGKAQRTVNKTVLFKR